MVSRGDASSQVVEGTAHGESEKLPCALPLLQVWPSQDSPRGEADGQSFVFPPDEGLEAFNPHDSGIESVQVCLHSSCTEPLNVVKVPVAFQTETEILM